MGCGALLPTSAPRPHLSSCPLLCRLWTGSRRRGWGTATTPWTMRPFTPGCGRTTCTLRYLGGAPGRKARRGLGAGAGPAVVGRRQVPGLPVVEVVAGLPVVEVVVEQHWDGRAHGNKQQGGHVTVARVAWGRPCQPHTCSYRSAPGPATSQAPGIGPRSTRSFGEARSRGAHWVSYQESRGGRKCRHWAPAIRSSHKPCVNPRRLASPSPYKRAAEAQMCCDATEEQTELGARSSLSWTAVSCCPRESPPSSPAS